MNITLQDKVCQRFASMDEAKGFKSESQRKKVMSLLRRPGWGFRHDPISKIEGQPERDILKRGMIISNDYRRKGLMSKDTLKELSTPGSKLRLEVAKSIRAARKGEKIPGGSFGSVSKGVYPHVSLRRTPGGKEKPDHVSLGHNYEGGWAKKQAALAAEAYRKAPVISDSKKIAKSLIRQLEMDSGGYTPEGEAYTEVQRKALPVLMAAIKQMQSSGFKFKMEDIENLAAGEQTEVLKRYGKIKGFQKLTKALDYVFGEEGSPE